MEKQQYKYRYRLNAYEIKNVGGKATYVADMRHIPLYLSSGALRKGDFTLVNIRSFLAVTSSYNDAFVASGSLGVEAMPIAAPMSPTDPPVMANTSTRDFSLSGAMGNTSLNGRSWDLLDKINLELVDMSYFTRSVGPNEIPEIAGVASTCWLFVYELLE